MKNASDSHKGLRLYCDMTPDSRYSGAKVHGHF